MCTWKSAVVSRHGEVYHSEYTDSHEDIIALNHIKDGTMRNIVRVEYVPDDPKNIANVKKYKLKLDEKDAPAWWDEDMAESVCGKMEAIVSACILRKKTMPVLMGGCWILVDCEIAKIGHALIKSMAGGTVQEVGAGGTVQKVWAGGTVQEVGVGGTVQKVWAGGTVVKDFRTAPHAGRKEESNG